jgi:hypothetical protein
LELGLKIWGEFKVGLDNPKLRHNVLDLLREQKVRMIYSKGIKGIADMYTPFF